jgi:hypothetical protein
MIGVGRAVPCDVQISEAVMRCASWRSHYAVYVSWRSHVTCACACACAVHVAGGMSWQSHTAV